MNLIIRDFNFLKGREKVPSTYFSHSSVKLNDGNEVEYFFHVLIREEQSKNFAKKRISLRKNTVKMCNLCKEGRKIKS